MRALVSGPSRTESGTIMNVVVRIPTPLRAITNGRGEHRSRQRIRVEEAFGIGFERAYAGIKGQGARTTRRAGDLNVYVNEEDIRFLQGSQRPSRRGTRSDRPRHGRRPVSRWQRMT